MSILTKKGGCLHLHTLRYLYTTYKNIKELNLNKSLSSITRSFLIVNTSFNAHNTNEIVNTFNSQMFYTFELMTSDSSNTRETRTFTSINFNFYFLNIKIHIINNSTLKQQMKSFTKLRKYTY